MNTQWNFVDENKGTYPYWVIVIQGKKVAMVVHRPECYKLTIFTHGHEHYWSKDYATLQEAEAAFLHEYVALRLEGKV